MARPTLGREELTDRLLAVFREHGYEGASLARLSEATGLVKASLYYQFPKGKEDMAAAVLSAMEKKIRTSVIAPLSDPALAPAERVAAFGAALSNAYDGGRSFCVIDVFGIGEAGDLFRQSLARAVALLSEAASSFLREQGFDPEEVARRAEETLVALQGSLVLSRATKNTGPFERFLASLPGRLLR